MTNKRSILQVVIDATGAKIGEEAVLKAYERMSKAASSFSDSTSRFSKTMGSSFTKAFNAAWKGAKAFWSKMQRLEQRLVEWGSGIYKAWKNTFGKAFDILLPLGVMGSLKKVIEQGLKYQKFKTTMTVITDSVKEAGKELEWLMEQTNRVGVSFEASAAPFAKFAAAAKGILSKGAVKEIFSAFAEVGAAMHMNRQEVQGVFLALQQMASKGRVSMEELRLQLAERIPGAMQMAAKAMKMDVKELEDAIRASTVSAKDFLLPFAQELHKKFADAAMVASNSAIGAFRRLQNALFDISRVIAHSGFLAALADASDRIAQWLRDNMDIAEEIGKLFGAMVHDVTNWATSITKDEVRDFFVGMKDTLSSIYGIFIDIGNSSFFKWIFGGAKSTSMKDELVSKLEDAESRFAKRAQEYQESKRLIVKNMHEGSLHRLSMYISDIRSKLANLPPEQMAATSKQAIPSTESVVEDLNRKYKIEANIESEKEFSTRMKLIMLNSTEKAQLSDIQKLRRQIIKEEVDQIGIRSNALNKELGRDQRETAAREYGRTVRNIIELNKNVVKEEKRITSEKEKQIRLNTSLTALSAKIMVSLQGLSGEELSSKILDVSNKYDVLMTKVQKLGRQTGKDISTTLDHIEKSRGLEIARTVLTDMSDKAKEFKSDIDIATNIMQGRLNVKVDAGQMSEMSAMIARSGISQMRLDILSEYREKLLGIKQGWLEQGKAGEKSFKAVSAEIALLEINMDRLRNNVDELGSHMKEHIADAMGDALNSVLDDTKSFKDAFLGIFDSIFKEINRMISQQMATDFLNWMNQGSGTIGGSASGLISTGMNALFSGADSSSAASATSGALKSVSAESLFDMYGMANGGSFKVGGVGGTDSQLVAFKASPNEKVKVTRPDQEPEKGNFTVINKFIVAPGSSDTLVKSQQQISEVVYRTASRAARRLG